MLRILLYIFLINICLYGVRYEFFMFHFDS